jgi:hypothetical protein
MLASVKAMTALVHNTVVTRPNATSATGKPFRVRSIMLCVALDKTLTDHARCHERMRKRGPPSSTTGGPEGER